MDLKKEIKLSDLLPKRKKRDAAEKPKAPKEPRPAKAAKPKRERAGRTKKLVGLKVGASQIAAARVVNNGAPELVQVAREELDSGLVVGGELREPEELAQALRNFFRKHKLPRQNVRLGISNNRVGVRTFEIAGVADEKQLANAIKYRAQETLPIPVEEAVLDYQILGERTDDEGVLHRRVLLVVAYRDLVDRYLVACKKAGIKLVGIHLGHRGCQRRPRPDDVRRLRRSDLPVHACARVGRPLARRCDRQSARPVTLGGPADQARALPR
jgi:Tfp pilus assembly PilM family ATPase